MESETCTIQEDLKDMAYVLLLQISKYREMCKKNNCLNEQFYIDFEMELNRISVEDPNTSETEN